ncbi:MAG: AarF/UbiB family protein [Desulfobacterales bacterium]|jgi:ubiquinone biosynthesis protein|nr:AarF/UbiB family protein [Desulfobacterales bacterium]
MLSIRKIGVVGRTYRNFNRYRQILTILFKYGFGDLIELLKIDQYIEVGLQLISKNRPKRLEKLSRAERVRMAFEELGPTYVKLGQILSTRPDLIPIDFTQELSKLQDKVPSFSFDEAKRTIESEFSKPLEELFVFFSETPVAAASIGQVHKARLKDGEMVAVKIQRPGIKKIIEIDLEIMLHLATLVERNIEEMARYRPVKIVEEFARTLEREIDYTIEASSMERFARHFLDDSNIYIPTVFRNMSTEHVLTMELMDGIKVSEIDRLEEAGLDRKKVTARGADFYLKQVFDLGFFHADPHPGNIFILPENVICLIDFGMTGAVDRQTREDFVDLIGNVIHRHEARVTQVLLKLTHWEEEPHIRQLEKDVSDFMGRHLHKPLKDIEIGKVLNNLLELASRHRLMIAPDIFLMMKTLTMVEGVALALDPDFDMIAQAEPFIKRVKFERFYPGRITDDMIQLGSQMLQFAQQFPKDVLEITRLVRLQKLSLKMEHKGLDTMLATHDRVSNRISFSIIIAALIIGSALIVISEIPPLFYGISLIGIVLFSTAAIMGFWLLIAILKKGRL